MNFYHLKYFYDSARMKSVTKAAEINSVGQPAISKGIQSLEAALKKTLLVHERNRFQLTDEGERVFSYCQKIFNATEELRDSLAHEKSLSGEVRFAWQSSMAECDFLTKALKTVQEQHPHLSLKLRLGRTDLVRGWIQSGLIDFGVVIENIDLSDFETTTLAKGFFHLVKSKSYTGNWRRDGVLTVEGKREVIELQRLYKTETAESLKSKMEIGSWGVIRKFVIEGMGVGFVPDYMIQQDLKDKALSLVESKKFSVPYEMKLIRRQSKYVPRKNQILMDEICKLAPAHPAH